MDPMHFYIVGIEPVKTECSETHSDCHIQHEEITHHYMQFKIKIKIKNKIGQSLKASSPSTHGFGKLGLEMDDKANQDYVVFELRAHNENLDKSDNNCMIPQADII